MTSITIDRLSLVIVSVEPTVYGSELLVMGKVGKRGGLLASRWLAVRDSNGNVSRFIKWM